MGGSQGARALNEAMPKIAHTLAGYAIPQLTIEHQCGARHVDRNGGRLRAGHGADSGRVMSSLDF